MRETPGADLDLVGRNAPGLRRRTDQHVSRPGAGIPHSLHARHRNSRRSTCDLELHRLSDAPCHQPRRTCKKPGNFSIPPKECLTKRAIRERDIGRRPFDRYRLPVCIHLLSDDLRKSRPVSNPHVGMRIDDAHRSIATDPHSSREHKRPLSTGKASLFRQTGIRPEGDPQGCSAAEGEPANQQQAAGRSFASSAHGGVGCLVCVGHACPPQTAAAA